jgi:hypothetical protein
MEDGEDADTVTVCIMVKFEAPKVKISTAVPAGLIDTSVKEAIPRTIVAEVVPISVKLVMGASGVEEPLYSAELFSMHTFEEAFVPFVHVLVVFVYSEGALICTYIGLVS